MAAETPSCRRERLVADVNKPAHRRAIYSAAGPTPSLMLTEGLLMYLPASTVEALAEETGRETNILHWISDIRTSSFSKAIGGDGASVIRHVQAEDYLEGEQILQTLYRHGWVTAARRSYITDLAFAVERIGRMIAARPQGAAPPAFAPDDPTGVHRFNRA